MTPYVNRLDMLGMAAMWEVRPYQSAADLEACVP
jgi:hypothetical protein